MVVIVDVVAEFHFKHMTGSLLILHCTRSTTTIQQLAGDSIVLYVCRFTGCTRKAVTF